MLLILELVLIRGSPQFTASTLVVAEGESLTVNLELTETTSELEHIKVYVATPIQYELRSLSGSLLCALNLADIDVNTSSIAAAEGIINR